MSPRVPQHDRRSAPYRHVRLRARRSVGARRNARRAARRAFLYLADQASAPYGVEAPKKYLCGRAHGVAARARAKMVVVACNTASAEALDLLRGRHPEIPFVGMEPAVKPAAAQSRTKVIGVLATTGTLNARSFASLVVRHAAGVKVVERACPGLADMVERGNAMAPKSRSWSGGSSSPCSPPAQTRWCSGAPLHLPRRCCQTGRRAWRRGDRSLRRRGAQARGAASRGGRTGGHRRRPVLHHC